MGSVDLIAPPDCEASLILKLVSADKYRRYAYCLLAGGFIDLIVEAGLKTYDVVALVPIIEGAGGRITTWQGKPATEGGRIVAAGDARLHKEALAVLRTVA
jgi:myo-inositol-1(or 4)-monophosphatase